MWLKWPVIHLINSLYCDKAMTKAVTVTLSPDCNHFSWLQLISCYSCNEVDWRTRACGMHSFALMIEDTLSQELYSWFWTGHENKSQMPFSSGSFFKNSAKAKGSRGKNTNYISCYCTLLNIKVNTNCTHPQVTCHLAWFTQPHWLCCYSCEQFLVKKKEQTLIV